MRVPGQDLRMILKCRCINYRIGNAPLFHAPPHGPSCPCNVKVHGNQAAPEPDLGHHKVHTLLVVAIGPFKFRDSHHRRDFVVRPLNNITNAVIALPVLNPCPRVENDSDVNPLRYTCILSDLKIPRNPKEDISAVP